jgi:hypothetical protein
LLPECPWNLSFYFVPKVLRCYEIQTANERDHLEDLSLDVRVILKWMLQKQGKEWIGFIWLSAGKTGGLSLGNDE